MADTERIYTEATQEFVAKFGKTFEWSHKVQIMGRKELEAARKLAELLELPLTAEEARDGLKIILTEKFPDSQLLPGILLKHHFFLVAGGVGWGRGLLVPFSARSAPCSYPGKFINICLLTYNMNIN